ncbi:conserved oligomeric Golgi complex subunit 1-like [Penaeus vannamei]|uniref:conserved oligomeric Golgi complex subunit 1-like n=1 Tax=Penaeus vannamei TaxID=6689 RepID=UPI00387FB0DA
MPAVTAEDDVTLLFERHTVVQVEDILKKTRSDIEKKKEDLRVMVGERYRDLIEAADTISEMRNSAEAICGNIRTMEGLCESLQQRGLIGFKTQSHHSNGTLRSPTPGSHYSVAVQVKLLVAVPEILWSLTERCHYLPATQLLLLAHHTHTALQLAPNASKVCLLDLFDGVTVFSLSFLSFFLRGEIVFICHGNSYRFLSYLSI